MDFIGGARDIIYDDTDTYRIYVLTDTEIFILNQDLQIAEPPVHLGIDPEMFECDYMAESYSESNQL